jgi:hypothetical protein
MLAAVPLRNSIPWKVVRAIAYVGFAAFLSWGTAERRGPVLGILLFLFYGPVFGALALSPSRLRRFSLTHPVLDSLFVVPFGFFALMVIPALPWWGAALIALALGMIFVPWVVHRRAAHQRSVHGDVHAGVSDR